MIAVKQVELNHDDSEAEKVDTQVTICQRLWLQIWLQEPETITTRLRLNARHYKNRPTAAVLLHG